MASGRDSSIFLTGSIGLLLRAFRGPYTITKWSAKIIEKFSIPGRHLCHLCPHVTSVRSHPFQRNQLEYLFTLD